MCYGEAALPGDKEGTLPVPPITIRDTCKMEMLHNKPMIRAMLQLKLLVYGTSDIAAMTHKGTEHWPLLLKEQCCDFLDVFMKSSALKVCLLSSTTTKWQPARKGREQGIAF